MVVAKSTYSTHNRTAYSNINKSKLAQTKLEKNQYRENESEIKPTQRVKIKDSIEINEKIQLHTEYWLG